MSLRVLNPNAEVLNKSAALHMNINAAKGLQDVLKSNLGPKGTIKMYDIIFDLRRFSLSKSASMLIFPLRTSVVVWSGLWAVLEISNSPKMATLCLKKWSVLFLKPYIYLRSLISTVSFLNRRVVIDFFSPVGFLQRRNIASVVGLFI